LVSKTDTLRESVDYFVGLIAEKLNVLDEDLKLIRKRQGNLGDYLWREWLRRTLSSRGSVYRFESYFWRVTGDSDVFRYIVVVSAEVKVSTSDRVGVAGFDSVGEVGLYYVPRKCVSRLVSAGDVKVRVRVEEVRGLGRGRGGRYVVVVDDEGAVTSFARGLLETVKNYVPSVGDMCLETVLPRVSVPFVYRR